MDTATKTGLDALKTASTKFVHKAAEATVQLIRNKIAEKFVKPKHGSNENSRNVDEMVIPPEKREQLTIIKGNIKYLNHSMIQLFQSFWQETGGWDFSKMVVMPPITKK